MEQDSIPPQRAFMQAFFGSFVGFKEYPLFAERPTASAAGHFVLLVTLVCSLYAGMTSYWVKTAVDPVAASAIAEVPPISIKDGVASSTVAQPHIVEVDKQPLFILDTTQEPQVHLDKYPAIAVLSADRISIKKTNGEIESHKLEGNFEITSSLAASWYETAVSWMLPVMFVFCLMWQLSWKSVQVLLVAGIVTLVNGSRPSFSTHLRLACYALSPAMAWGLFVYTAWLFGVFIPGAGLIFWGLLFGITAKMAATIKKTPKYH